MQTKQEQPSIVAVYQLYHESDEIYHIYARQHDLSDTALAILYSLHGQKTPYTQRALCAEWHIPPQTLNSILKGLEKKKLVTLTPDPSNRRTKQVSLTEQGTALAEQVIAPLKEAEERVFNQLSPKEQETLLMLTRKYLVLLREEIN